MAAAAAAASAAGSDDVDAHREELRSEMMGLMDRRDAMEHEMDTLLVALETVGLHEELVDSCVVVSSIPLD